MPHCLADSADALGSPAWGAAPPPWAPGRREGTHAMTADDTDQPWCVAEVDIFCDISEQEMESIATAAPMKSYSSGEILYEPTQPSEVLFIRKKGRVRVFRVSADGRALTTAVITPGTIFGENPYPRPSRLGRCPSHPHRVRSGRGFGARHRRGRRPSDGVRARPVGPGLDRRRRRPGPRRTGLLRHHCGPAIPSTRRPSRAGPPCCGSGRPGAPLTRTTAVTHLRRAGALAPRIGGGLLLLVGAYVAYYGWYEIRVQRDPATQDPVIDAAGAVQRVIADTLDAVGPALFATLLLAGYLSRRRRRVRHPPEPSPDTPPPPRHSA
ncbi:cyclic nucleotide-binding domain-containing protein [Streptomyces sp. A3M-1-3]|uniref:Crp/Fnr family transcriptional regulator n=1 Tax=Streptomyces sp. A3M-1-3 TaxID=2962044 RepID=UPI0020B6975D|nr:cyclic nucleotide-binding domain-containing protein [Streptomyces sp. A3M-1-3]MCP3821697.1 cyclic nucleotide-binding domain-containing protein [Streptomyces sp. A3M-1-3]